MQILRVEYEILNYIYILYYVVIFALAMDGLKTKKKHITYALDMLQCKKENMHMSPFD